MPRNGGQHGSEQVVSMGRNIHLEAKTIPLHENIRGGSEYF